MYRVRDALRYKEMPWHDWQFVKGKKPCVRIVKDADPPSESITWYLPRLKTARTKKYYIVQ